MGHRIETEDRREDVRELLWIISTKQLSCGWNLKEQCVCQYKSKWAGAKLNTIGTVSAVAQMHCDVFGETEDDLRKILQGLSFNDTPRTVPFKWIPNGWLVVWVVWNPPKHQPKPLSNQCLGSSATPKPWYVYALWLQNHLAASSPLLWGVTCLLSTWQT